ncbi:taurine ABC transporter, periplasmic binding protein [Candidatus Magnetobacterium bavaricum]|uniref:Taurine ABC transporter, periplasmic binding protein n=1 Tax=Candidatus Magnetobacterium bavaricum TaxID=29290 RepID=A0A0F3H0K7_9BACT|nr:taurine ABC transporter, periplasmic binding protein [Candidatus Magnetobacterium bavaricum]
MKLSTYIKITVSVVVSLLLGAFCSVGYASSDTPTDPRYSKYKFEKGKNVINVGVQPMSVPQIIITETMSRDVVLYNTLKELGMEIKFFPFLKGFDINYFLLKGDLQAGVSGDAPTVVAASTDKVIVASLMQYGFTSIVGSKHLKIKNLRNAIIGYAFGSNAHYALLNALSIGGGTPKSGNLVKMDVTEMVDSLKNHKIEAFSAWEPTVTEALTTLRGVDVIYSKVTTGYLYFGKDLYTSRPDVIDALVASELRALRWLQKDNNNLLTAVKWASDKQASFTGKASPLTTDQIADIALNDLVGMMTNPRLPISEFKENGILYNEFNFLKSIGLIQSTVSLDVVYKNFVSDIIERIVANPKKYKLNEYQYK